MVRYTKLTIPFITAMLLLFAHSSYSACQCFNGYFLQSIFHNSQNVQCFVSTDKAILTDGRNTAVTSYYGCSLNSLSSNIQRQFYDFYGDENDKCMQEILNACGMLNAPMYPGN